MQLIIAEKPSLARAIVAALPVQATSMDGFYRAGDTFVTWCYGHLYELVSPEAYNPAWEKWDFAQLPITVPADAWKLRPTAGGKQQIAVIRNLLRDAKEVVNAGDPDREGQMLVDELLEAQGWTGKTRRLLLHDTTPESVRKALGAMRDNKDFRPLYEAAMCRSRADWLVGMNMTRATTTRIGVTASVGRVQTPTLALVVQRDLLIEGHKVIAFYTLHATVSDARDTLTLVHDTEHDRILDRAQAQQVASTLTGTLVTVGVSEKQRKELAPMPHVLATFQKAAEDRYGWTAAQALAALQGAYEAGYVSYPRTECAFLPNAQAKDARPIAEAILAAGHFPAAAANIALIEPKERIYNDAKVEQHHGLAPTRRLPAPDAAQDTRRAWEIIAERFIKSLLPDYLYAEKVASFTFDDRLFKAQGEAPINEAHSWRCLEPRLGRGKQPIKPLPLSWTNGQTGDMRAGDVQIKEGKTTPPKPYTESTLIADMASIHKYVTNEKLKAILKETAGIGTAATRSSIITALKDRKYLETVKGAGAAATLRSTRLGRYLIEHIPAALSDPGVTAAWEDALEKIARQGGSPSDFMARIDQYVATNVARLGAVTWADVPRIEPRTKGLPKRPARKGKGTSTQARGASKM